MNKLICILFLIIVGCRNQAITKKNDYQSMKQVIESYVKNTSYYEILQENHVQPKFYITNLSSDAMETINSDSLKENMLLKDGVYAFYIKDIRYSFTHIYIKHKGNVKIFESINCPSDNIKFKEAITYVENEFLNNQRIVDNIYNYSKYIQYFKIDPQSKLNCLQVAFLVFQTN